MVDIEDIVRPDSDPARLVFQHSDICLILVDKHAVLKLALCIQELVLTKDAHDVAENARLKFLLFEESSNDHCFLERFDI